ncbi:MAG: DUF1501 domain-containing protein, partial [Myxococcales bacterium]|nr:DUF1501 domain-containing protein [Myxococcales bacterium]
WVFVHANGGWDPTSLCDPKGRQNEEEEDPVNHYFTDDIGTAGNIKYAPVAYNAEFFQKHYRRTLVLNGVDSQTNNHDAGTRHTWSGKLSEGYPALAALIAGVQAREAPMAFLSNGGYDDTGGLIAPTRTGNIDALNRIAFPDRVDPNNPNGDRYHSPETWDRLQAAIAARQGHLTETLRLPRAQHAINQLFTARVGRNEVRRLSEFLPERFDDDGLKRQAQVAVAAFRAGIGKAANLSIGGFDTHGNHDQSHFPRLQSLTEGLDVLWSEAEAMGIADRVFVAVGSDFGRSPGYNDGQGKDHWPITSMMFMGAGVQGNRVVGASTDRHQSIGVNLDTLAVDNSPDAPHIEPGHVCQAIRKLAGVHESELAAMFPIENQQVPLFG